MSTRFMGLFGPLAVAMSLAACSAAPSLVEIPTSSGDIVRIVDTGVDEQGGPRLKSIQVVDRTGRIISTEQAASKGTFQDAANGFFGSVAQAAGFAGGMALLRPAQTYDSGTSTVVSTGSVSAGGGSAAGGSATGTGGNAAGGSAAGATANAAGGRGGRGGNATNSNSNDAFALGGNADARANGQCQNFAFLGGRGC